MRVGIIGGGSIGGSFAKALIAHHIVEPEHLLIVERQQQSCDELRRNLKCYVSTTFYPKLSEVDVVILAVKPQDFSSIAPELKPLLKPQQLVLSMMTGVRVQRLSEDLGSHERVIRCMPNLPFTVGQGFSVCFQTGHLSLEEKSKIQTILNASGKLLFVPNEDLIDAATALSASGPGFIAYLMHHYINAAKKLGFTEKDASMLVGQTLLGTATMLLQSESTALEIQSRVASKGGTTEAALTVLKEADVGKTLELAIEKAFLRARELANS